MPVTPEEIEPPADVDTEPSDGLETTVPTEEIENNPPLFTDGDTTLRVISENTPTATNIEIPVNATDEDGDLLTLSLSGTYASAFLITDVDERATNNINVGIYIKAIVSGT